MRTFQSFIWRKMGNTFPANLKSSSLQAHVPTCCVRSVSLYVRDFQLYLCSFCLYQGLVLILGVYKARTKKLSADFNVGHVTINLILRSSQGMVVSKRPIVICVQSSVCTTTNVSLTHVHFQSLLVYTSLHKLTLVYTNLHQFTQVYANLHKFTIVYTSLHQFTQLYASLHKFTLVYNSLHTFTLVYTGLPTTKTFFNSLRGRNKEAKLIVCKYIRIGNTMY